MATVNKFNSFVEDLAEKIHNLGADQLTVALTDTLPTASNTVLANITQISYTNISSRNITTSTSAQTSGTYKLVLADLTLTATGTVPQFRYVIVYNSSTGSGNLIGWLDYGSEVNLAVADSLVIDFDGTNGFLTLA